MSACAVLFLELQNLNVGRVMPAHTGQLQLHNPEFGHTTLHPGLFAKRFIREARAQRWRGKLLDIGAAFGVASAPLLNQRIEVIVNDLDQTNIDILLGAFTLPGNEGYADVRIGDFRNLEIPDGSLGAVNIGSVLHFLPGREVDAALEKIYRWLAPGGKIYLEVQTPYLAILEGPMFEQYVERKESGKYFYPGDYENLHFFHPEWERLKHLNLMDREIVSSALQRAGFIWISSKFFPREDYPIELTQRKDGRPYGTRNLRDFQQGSLIPHESVGAVATKPLYRDQGRRYFPPRTEGGYPEP